MNPGRTSPALRAQLPPDPVARFRADLRAHALLTPGPAEGVYLLGPVFEQVVQAVEALVGRLAPPGAELLRFPPVMDRNAFAATRYVANFPQLAGTVHCFCGDDDAHARLLACTVAGQDWSAEQQPSGVVLTPSSCYPVYAAIAARGRLPEAGLRIDAASWCFRHEPSPDPIRMLSFRQREQVCLGAEAHTEAFQAEWTRAAAAMFAALGLPATLGPASDPFFGRLGRFAAENQRGRSLKLEFRLPISDPGRTDACGSFNQHRDHFARAFGLRTADGQMARTACAGFGLERLALALFRHHGFQPDAWPAPVRAVLWPPH